jgi:hypothetical protein
VIRASTAASFLDGFLAAGDDVIRASTAASFLDGFLAAGR